MCALLNCRSVESTMGFTALDGLPMGTRSGQIDPGVLLYLMAEKGMSPEAVQKFLYSECGSKGLSGISNHVRDLQSSREPGADPCDRLFCASYRIPRRSCWLWLLAVSTPSSLPRGSVIGFLTMRARIPEKLAWLGAELNPTANASGETVILPEGNRVTLYVLPTNEELMIARHSLALLSAAAGQDSEICMTIPVARAPLLEGKKGLIVGIANDRSIAWGCAQGIPGVGSGIGGHLPQRQGKEVRRASRPRAEAPILMPLDVGESGQMEAVFDRIKKEWGRLDFLVHSIAFSPKEALGGRVTDVTRDGFLTTMDVSCWTFIRMAYLAEPLMKNGGTLFTMTYYGSQMVVKNYNIMGVAKAALECAVRYMAAELGPKGIRVHAISPGPLATRAASGIPEFDQLLDKARAKAPARSLVSIDDVGVATAFLAHDAAKLITGETLYIDGGYHIID